MDRVLKENARPSKLVQPGSFLRKPTVVPPKLKEPEPVKRKLSPQHDRSLQVRPAAKRPRISPNNTISAPPTRNVTAPASKGVKFNATQQRPTVSKSVAATRPVATKRQAPAKAVRNKPAVKAPPARPVRPEVLVRQLKQENEELQNQVDELKPELESYAAASSSKEDQIHFLEETVSMRDNELTSLHDEMKDQTCKIELLHSQLCEFSEVVEALQSELEGKKKVLEEQEVIITTLRSELSDRDSTITDKNNTIDNLHKKMSALREDLTERGEVIDRQRDTINKRDATITGLENKLEEARVREETLRSRLAELQLVLEARKQDIADRDVSISNLEAIKQGHIADIKNLNGDVSCRDAAILDLEAKIREAEMTRRQLHNTIQELKGNIRVFCRVRPLLGKETEGAFGDEIPHLSFTEDGKTLELARLSDASINESVLSQSGKGSKTNKYVFHFDSVFPPKSSQQEVFEEISQVVQSALDGYSVCIFAYGQTGSGKTYTMEGPDDPTPETWGMIPRAVDQVFVSSSQLEDQGWRYNFEASFLEIYNETIRDLLSNSRKKDVKHEIKMVAANSTEVTVTNLNTVKVTSPSEVHKLLHRASENRAVAETKVNERSSRSHSVFRLHIAGYNDKTEEKCSGYLNLIDLAGSERLKESKSEGDRLKETKSINSSLANLSNCISALANKDSHVPYRNSKLTHLLSNSLGGTSKVLMFLNLSPREECFSESLNSLRFATKVNNCHIGTAQKATK